MPSFLWPQGLQLEAGPVILHHQTLATGSFPKSPQMPVALWGGIWRYPSFSSLSVPCWTDFSTSVSFVKSLLPWLSPLVWVTIH